jgi:hypothetical protein
VTSDRHRGDDAPPPLLGAVCEGGIVFILALAFAGVFGSARQFAEAKGDYPGVVFWFFPTDIGYHPHRSQSFQETLR